MQDTKFVPKKRWALVVDDNPADCEQLSSFLKKRGYLCRMVNDAQQALNSAGKNQYDVVFLDAAMPGMDGYTACRKIKALPSYKPVPVVLLTSRESAMNRARGAMSGCTGYLAKPFAYDELDELVLNLRRSRRPDSSNETLSPAIGDF